MKNTSTDPIHPVWTVRWAKSMDEIPREDWDRLALPLQTPLLEWQWLHQLEASGSISPQYGWHPCHITLWADRRLIAAAPLYIKTHSQGEFVFDHWWVQLSQNNGIRYYPKLVGMSPVTPAEGYRFLMDEEADPAVTIKTMVAAIDQMCAKLDVSACQFNFVDASWCDLFAQHGFTAWQHQSYLWRNPGYATFDDYLDVFKSSQRRNIRREVNRMNKMGLRIECLTGDEIPFGLAGVMYDYYLKTNAQYGPWAARYLNGNFFERVFRHHRHRLLIIAAHGDGHGQAPLALSMLLVKGRHLIGRYWGCARPIKDLHFNMCFYAPIRWAIANGIETFDPGAGSPHKIYRGFKAQAATSLHRFYDRRLKFLFHRLIGEVNRMERSNIETLNSQLPFSQSNKGTLSPVETGT